MDIMLDKLEKQKMSLSNTSSMNISSNSVSPPSPSPPPPSADPSAFLQPENETARAPEVSNPQSPPPSPPPSSPPPSPPPSSPPPTPPPSSPPPNSPPPPNDPPPSSPPPNSPPPPNDPPPAPVTLPSPPPPQGYSLPIVNSPVIPPPQSPSPSPPVVWYQFSQSENSLSSPSPGSSGFSPPVQFPPPPTANPSTPLPGSQTAPTWSPPPSIPSPDSAPNLTPLAISNPSPKSGNNRGVVIGAAAAAMGVVVLTICAFLFFMVKKKRKSGFSVHYGLTPGNVIVQPDGYFYVQQPQNLLVVRSDGFYNGRPPLSPTVENHNASSRPGSGVIGLILCFSYEDLMEITNGFSKQNILGQGGFGYVYKGWLLDGRAVAVKQLKTGSNQGEREFRAEVEIISRIHHRHLVSLVGYCIAENQRLLVYEFLPNNNLYHHLHGKGTPVMEWPKRLKIALGAARGLAYLHDDCNPKIIHRDIKSANILLDDAFEAQLSDFGLAKIAIDYDTHVSTRVVGTVGYMAPEYATSGKLTDRSDVYSFGVVLLELVTGRKAIDPTQPLGDESLVEWARPLLIHALDTGDFAELIDPKLESKYVESEMLRMIEAAAACVRHAALRRPRMVQVLRALDSECDVLIDLNNGLKLGQSTAYDSAEYSVEIKRFRRMNFGSWESSDYDILVGDGQSSNEVSLNLEESCSVEFRSSSDSESHLLKSPHSKQGSRLKPR